LAIFGLAINALKSRPKKRLARAERSLPSRRYKPSWRKRLIESYACAIVNNGFTPHFRGVYVLKQLDKKDKSQYKIK